MPPSNKETPHSDLVRSRLALSKTKTVRAWARSRGHKVKTVYGVLNGRLTGARGGKAAKIAKQLRELIAA